LLSAQSAALWKLHGLLRILRDFVWGCDKALLCDKAIGATRVFAGIMQKTHLQKPHLHLSRREPDYPQYEHSSWSVSKVLIELLKTLNEELETFKTYGETVQQDLETLLIKILQKAFQRQWLLTETTENTGKSKENVETPHSMKNTWKASVHRPPRGFQKGDPEKRTD
jgi:hypothetical protein